MNIKIAFHNMDHSQPMENHARQKLAKVLDFFADKNVSPFSIEVWLKANPQHAHHVAEIHVKAGHDNLHTHDENADMYIAFDNAVHKMMSVLTKEKKRKLDERIRPVTEKSLFNK